MFTGIVQCLGELAAREPEGGDVRLRVKAGSVAGGFDLGEARIGDSIAVNGACLTVVALSPGEFAVDVSRETLTVTTLGELRRGDPLNLEASLTPGSRLGGHLVSGHVDGIGTVLERGQDARSIRFTLSVPDRLARYVAAKGSICVDGVSLTVNEVDGTRFSVNIIPHTAAVTTLGRVRAGSKVNLEVDLLARYLERLSAAHRGEL